MPKKTATTRVLSLDGEMTIYRANELKTRLMDALEQTEVLEVNLAGVSEIDTSGIQVLMLVKNAAMQSQRSLRLISHSPAVLEAMDLLNLASFFGDPVVLPSAAD